MTPDALNRLRREWFTELAERAFPSHWFASFPSLAALPPMSRLTVMLMVGMGHLLGMDDHDLAPDGVLNDSEVEQLIIKGWRGAAIPADFAGWLGPSLVSMRWAAGRYEHLDLAPLGSWLESSHFNDRFSELSPLWHSRPDYSRDLASATRDAPPQLSLEELSLWLHATRPDDIVLLWFTPLEARFLGPDPERDRARTILESAGSEMYVPLLMPGAWPNKPHGLTPAWFRDVVTIEGARTWHSSSGYVPTLSVVVETDRDERSLTPWSYAPTLASRFPSSSRVELFILLDPDDDPAYLPFYFDYTEHRARQHLDVMLTVGYVRIEFYRLRNDGHLHHLWNFGVPLFALDAVREHRGSWLGPSPDPFALAATAGEMLQMIDLRQRAVFESTLPSFDPRSVTAKVSAAWERQLQVLDDAARSQATGRPIDERVLAEAAAELRLAEATERRVIDPPDEQRIHPGEALLQISIKEDTRWFSTAVVYRTPDRTLHGIPLFLEPPDDDPTPGDSPPDPLTTLLAPLHDLAADGVRDVVISAGHGAYSLPLHDAILRIGFRSATYCHAMRLMHRRPAPADDERALILGYPGAGTHYIAAADAELDIIAALTQAPRVTNGWRTAWPRTVHIAGHGVAGEREHESGILLADNDFLSAAGILRTVDASDTHIAFLSACSSGAGRIDVGRAARAIPLDVALLEKGCRTVISTSAPVNDHVALIFATTFHHALACGASTWDSYFEARSTFTAATPHVARDVQDLLDTAYPRWRLPLPPAVADDWVLFRYSGDR